eukprot:8963342-Alexandrium_andersonii.AAC.1
MSTSRAAFPIGLPRFAVQAWAKLLGRACVALGHCAGSLCFGCPRASLRAVGLPRLRLRVAVHRFWP